MVIKMKVLFYRFIFGLVLISKPYADKTKSNYVIKNNGESVTVSGESGCSTGLLPPDANYATGSAANSIQKTNGSAEYSYEWNSGQYGGTHKIRMDNQCRSGYFESSFFANGKNFKEVLDLKKKIFLRTINTKNVVGKLLTSDRSQPTKDTSQFQCTFGCNKISNPKDLSSSISLSWLDTGVSVTIEVKDDVVKFGDKLKHDHIEWWVSTSGVVDLEKKASPENSSQVILFCDKSEKVSAIYGFPDSKKTKPEISGTCKIQNAGYIYQFVLPVSLLSRRKIVENKKAKTVLEEGDVFLTTFLVSDSDKGDKQESIIATSPIKWGMPQTFGRLILIDDGRSPIVSQNLMLE